MNHRCKSSVFSCLKVRCLTVISLLSLLIICNGKSQAQTEPRSKIVAAYLYNFARETPWPGEDTFKSFRILIIGTNTRDLQMELNALSKNRTLKQRPIIVSASKTTPRPVKAQLVYVHPDAAVLLPSLLQQINGNPILLVSDNYSDKKLIMLNLDDTPDGRVLFELHRANMINQGFKVTEDLILLGGTEVDVARLYREGQQSQRKLQQYSDSLEQNIALLEQTLQKKSTISKRQRDSIQTQQERIKQQQRELKMQQTSIAGQQARIRQQWVELTTREKELQRLLDSISVQKDILDLGTQEIADQQTRIKKQSAEIASHLSALEMQQEQIRKQRYITGLVILVALLVLALLALIYRGYKRSGQLNKILEQKVNDRTQELLKTNLRIQEQLQVREQLEKELIATNTHLSNVLGSMTDAFITLDRQYRITYMNAEAERINQKPATQSIGKTHWEEWPASLGTLVEQNYRNAMTERIPVHFEHHYSAEGHYDVWLDIHAYPTEEGLAIYYHDISLRKQAEQKLRKSETALEEAQSIARLGSWEVQLKTGDVSWSKEMFVLTGTENQAEPLTINEFMARVHREDRPYLAHLFDEAMKEGVSFTNNFRLLLPSESYGWFEARVRPVIDAEGKVTGLAGILLDIAERKQREEKLEERVVLRTAELAKEKERAEAADRVKSAFLATMSHELRTPLNSIIGFTGILLKKHPGPLNAEQEKQMGMVQRSARHLLDLINDVLDISKIEAGELDLHYSQVNVLQLLQEILELVDPMARQKGIDLLMEAPEAALEIHTDNRRAKQVILNIVNNAVKFTTHGFVKVSSSVSEKNILISVMDTGIGIPEDQVEIIFKPFSQVDNGLTRAHEGTGLGLSISLKLAKMLGGNITLTSRPGIGSIFTISLPIQSIHL